MPGEPREGEFKPTVGDAPNEPIAPVGSHPAIDAAFLQERRALNAEFFRAQDATNPHSPEYDMLKAEYDRKHAELDAKYGIRRPNQTEATQEQTSSEK